MQDKSTPSVVVCPLLYDTPPIPLHPKLATAIGVEQAIILQQIHYWLTIYTGKKDRSHFHEGRYWIYNSLPQWNAQFPFWSKRTIQRTLLSLERPYEGDEIRCARGPLLLAEKLGGRLRGKFCDQTKWYSIDAEAVSKLTVKVTESPSCQFGTIERATLARSTSETSSEIGGAASSMGLQPVAAAGTVQTVTPIRCKNDKQGTIVLQLDVHTPLKRYLEREPSQSMITSAVCAVKRRFKWDGTQITQDHLNLAGAEAWQHWERQYGYIRDYGREKPKPRGFFIFEEALRKAISGEICWSKP
jgi:hypothetical protein